MERSSDFALLEMAWNRPRKLVTIEQLNLFVKRGKITVEEFRLITGQDYTNA
ncbi:XkdX family protein [Bacillus sp. REN10]|uniref:XkdX family protein n=1 Tax=Bacillus sp. REN10 TaxID=2782541 RepID=UPI001EEE753C|nr:XkdX family protein [Bacillus sp. REN10]